MLAACADETGPRVLGTTPENAATEVELGTAVVVELDEAIDADTVTASSFVVSGGPTGAVPGSRLVDGRMVSFEHEGLLVDGVAYTATLTTQLTDLAGNPLAAEHSWSFTTRSRVWGAAAPLDVDDVGEAQYPRLAIAPTGAMMVVWRQADASFDDHVWANYYLPVSGWQGPSRIDTTGEFTSSLRVAMDAGGNAVAVWTQSDGVRDSIWANRFSADTGWATAQLLETSDDDAREPEIAMDSAGMALCVWQQGGTVWAARYDATSGWQVAESLDLDGTDHSRPHVALTPSGDGIVVWHHTGKTGVSVRARRYTPAGGFEPAESIDTGDAVDTGFARVAINRAGEAVAVWSQNNGDWDNIWANRYRPGSGWAGPDAIAALEGGSAERPQVGIDDAGNAVAVWQQFSGARLDIWANHYTAGGGWAAAEPIEQGFSDAELARLTMSPGGQAVAVWQQGTGDRIDIFANRFLVGAGWGVAEPIHADDLGAALNADVAFDPDDNAIAVWQQRTGTYGVMINRRE